MLLDAGADPSTAIHCTITHEDDVGLKAPLDRGSCLFAHSITPKTRNFWHVGWYSESILSYALWYTRVRRNFNPKILPLIIEALARSRRCLMAPPNKLLDNQYARQSYATCHFPLSPFHCQHSSVFYCLALMLIPSCILGASFHRFWLLRLFTFIDLIDILQRIHHCNTNTYRFQH